MEPSISRDGRFLFFNNSNDPTVNTNLHYAERIDDLTFQYRGEIGGVNTSALEGVASIDGNGVFYFVTTRSYAQTLSTIYRGNFSNGAVSAVEIVPGVSSMVAGMVNFDAEISPDGTTLYFADGQAAAVPTGFSSADIHIGQRQGAGFARSADSAAVMARVNTAALEYAPAISASQLDLLYPVRSGHHVNLRGASAQHHRAVRDAGKDRCHQRAGRRADAFGR